MPTTENFDDAFADLKGGFDAVAGWNTGAVRDTILEIGNIALIPGGGPTRLAAAFDEVMDDLEEQALNSPAAAQALDELTAAMSKAMARGMSM